MSAKFSLFKAPPLEKYPQGMRIDATKANFPALQGLSLSYLKLEKNGLREPHWHPNAHELNYCIKGKALVTVFSPHNLHERFLLSPGEISFIPMGSIHSLENVGNEPLEMLVCFNHEQAEDLSLSSSVSAMSNEMLGKTFNTQASAFEKLTRSKNGVFISQVNKTSPLPPFTVNPNKFGLEKKNPEVNVPGGQVRMSNQALFPPLDGLAVYSLFLNPNGAREPHWHPNADELNCLLNGAARITLVSPEGKVETFELEAGDISFLPKGYFHHIENLTKETIHFAIFFDHVFPSDIGLSGTFTAYPPEILASIFKVDPNFFASLPKYEEDLFVVGGG